MTQEIEDTFNNLFKKSLSDSLSSMTPLERAKYFAECFSVAIEKGMCESDISWLNVQRDIGDLKMFYNFQSLSELLVLIKKSENSAEI